MELEFEVHPKLLDVLARKGADEDSILAITLNPSYENLLDPGEMPNMGNLVKALLRSAGRREKILVWGHEDADGITSVSVMLRTLEKIGASAGYYIPSKHSEGHGLSLTGIADAKEKGYGLVVTVDTGSGDLDIVEEAQKMGVEVLITDHHELVRSTEGIVVVNPKLGGAFRYLAGVGVAFKVAWATLSLKFNYTLADIERELPELLAFVAIGTVADKVPLFSENKALVDRGREVLARYSFPFVKAYERVKGQRPSLEALIALISAGKSEGYYHPGVELLTTRDEARAEEIVSQLVKVSEEWYSKAEALFREILPRIKRVKGYILVDLGETEPGFLSYISSKLKSRFDVPVIALGRREDGKVIAEIRAPYGYNILDLLEHLSPLLLDYGGHPLAGGFTMESEYMADLAEEVEYYFTHGKAKFDETRGADLVLEASDSEAQELLDNAERLGKLGVEIRFLIKGDAKEVSELFTRYEVDDPEGLLSLYPPGKKVQVVAVSQPAGFKIEKVWTD